ncbi:MAG: phosphoribosylanthranilate isomerase [Pyrinomonadaceae bacterium]
MVKIKICGITNLDDALAAVEAGADALGFNFYPRSPRYIGPAAARRVIEEMPPAVTCVGVFVNEDSPAAVARLAENAGVAVVQLHGDETASYCRALNGRRIIKALRVRHDFAPEDALPFETEAILLDAYNPALRGGTGERCDWESARRTRELVPQLYLAGGLVPGNVAEAIVAVSPYAVDVCSGVESSPGRKDHALLRAFVAAARRAAAPS